MPLVFWLPGPGVTRAELAVPCSTCNVTIGQECNTGGGVAHPLPHRARADLAAVYGFRTLAGPGPLFVEEEPHAQSAE